MMRLGTHADHAAEAERLTAELVESLHLPQRPLDPRDASLEVVTPEPEFCGHHGRRCECDEKADAEWAGRWGA